MGELGAADGVADRIDAPVRGAQAGIDGDPARAMGDASAREVEGRDAGLAAGGDEMWVTTAVNT